MDVREDIDRILALPVFAPPTEATIRKVSRRVLKPGAKSLLFGPQVAAYLMFRKMKGSFVGPINVGWGKGWLNIILAQEALQMGFKRVLVFMPVPMFRTYFTREMPEKIRPVYEVWANIVSLYGKSAHLRAAICQHQHSGVYFMPYSLLSQPDAEDLLEAMAPDNIILDEAQNVARPSSASSKRLMRYLNRGNLQCKLSLMSGTMTRTNLMDYHHLVRRSLGGFTPMPLQVSTAVEWSRHLSAGADMEDVVLNHGLVRLMRWYRKTEEGQDCDNTLVGARRAFSYRFLSAPGVAGTGENEVDIPLEVYNLPTEHKPGLDLQRLLLQLEHEWLSPIGEELNFAMHVWRCFSELTAGFYYHLSWPTPEEAEARGIPAEVLQNSIDHHQAKLDYGRELRKWFDDAHIRGVDSPMLVGHHLHLGNQDGVVPRHIHQLWLEAKALELPTNIERDRRPVYIDDYKIQGLLDWIRSLPDPERGGLIWYRYRAVGPWLTEKLRVVGLDVLHCPAGDEANMAIEAKANKHKWIVASSRAHGTGKNLQYHFDRAFMYQWIRSARDAEQTIGRIHRNGQPSDNVRIITNQTLDFDHAMMAATLAEAAYIKQTIGGSQKLCLASFNPMPKEYPLDWLASVGLLKKTVTGPFTRTTT
jgi:hypothetical protein